MILGLTGGFGCGKSTAAKLFAERQFRHVDSDIVMREQVLSSPLVQDELRKRHGGSVFTPDGQVDRPALGKIVFSDDTERHWLESLTHPMYFEILRRMFRETPGRTGSSRCPSCLRSHSRIGLISRSAWHVIPSRNSLVWSSAVWTVRSPSNAYPSNCRWLGRSSCPISSFGMMVQPDFSSHRSTASWTP